MLNFFDLGQNKGEVSQMLINIAQDLGYPYKLFGFEANMQWYTHCKERFKENPHVVCVHAAITDTLGKVKLYGCKNGVGDSIFTAI